YADLVMYTYVLITRGVTQEILHHIANHATIPFIQNVFRDMVPLMSGVDEANVHERLAQAVKVLEETRSLRHGEETWSMYHELQHLFNIRTIDEIAQYQCILEQPVSSTNKPFAIALRIFTQLSTITRKLRIYLLRQSIDDRLAGLLEAINTIEEMHKFVEREYATQILGEATHRLPDHLLFTLLLKRWQNIVLAQLSELRGKAALKAELKTRHAWHEEQVGVVLVVSNTGRSSANNVKVTLLHSNEFDIASTQSVELESILAQEELMLEFIIEPHSSSPNLVFEIAYSDIEPSMKIELFGDRVELQISQQEFEYIPNPYSTGTPTHDSSMFYGREQDIAFLRDNLTRTSAKTVIVLYGQRRSGKTTLLHHLVRTTILDEHIPVLIDMQRFAYQISASKFFHNLAFHIYREMKKKGITLDQPAAQDFESDPTFAFDLFLDDVEDHLQGQRVILLIDEFEVLEDLVLKKKLEPEVFGYIRSLMQHRPYLNFLLSGTHQIEQLIKGYWSVFFNIALHYRLGKLNKQAARDLITKPVAPALEYEPHAVQKIRHLTADQPYLIHLICRSLVDHCNEKRKGYVTINDVNVVLHEVMQTGQFHFSWIWDNIQSEERLALSIIAHASKDERQRLSLIEIEEIYQQYHIPYKRERIVAILKSLIDADIIETPSDILQDTHNHTDTVRYRIPVGLIRQWLRKEKPIELAIREVM
ncbi:MAG: ATP-binding protein, partial [Chloroflexi bacterium]|nr:ATP-binding protein [Chloroflexota bacterium]